MNSRLSRRAFLRGATLAGLGVVAGLPLLSACTPKPTPTSAPKATEAPTKVEAKATPASAEQITLILHFRAGGRTGEKPIYVTSPEEYMKKYPNVKVEPSEFPADEYYVKLQTMFSAGTLGDVVFAADVWTDHTRLKKLKMLRSVNEYLDKEGRTVNEWVPAAVETLSMEGKMYGLPKTANPGEAFYFINDELFQQAGIPIPEPRGSTPEQAFEWAQKLSKGPKENRDIFGFSHATSIIPSIVNGGRQFGVYEANDDGTKSFYDDPKWLEWVKWVRSFYDAGLSPTPEQLPSGGLIGLWGSGKLAIYFSGRWGWSQCDTAMKTAEKKFNWRVLEASRVAQPKGWGALVDCHAVTTSSKHPDEAFQLISMMSDSKFTERVAKEIGYLGARVDDMETIKPFETPWLKLQYDGMVAQERLHQPGNARGREVESVVKNMLDPIWLKQKEPTAQFMAELKAATDEVLAKPF
jgi:ABC-type glycerol-3-phosphate transport system substrate-binding protein